MRANVFVGNVDFVYKIFVISFVIKIFCVILLPTIFALDCAVVSQNLEL